MKSTRFSTDRLKVPGGTADVEAHPMETATKLQDLEKRMRGLETKSNRRKPIGKIGISNICLGLLLLVAPIFAIVTSALDLLRKDSKLNAFTAACWSALLSSIASGLLNRLFPQNPPGVSPVKWQLIKFLFSTWVGWGFGSGLAVAIMKNSEK